MTDQTADEKTTTASYVTDALDRAQLAFNAALDPRVPDVRRRYACLAYAHHVSVAVLHEAFAHELPDRARHAVRWLETALEEDLAAEWVHEARGAIARGERVPLPFDKTDPEVSQ